MRAVSWLKPFKGILYTVYWVEIVEQEQGRVTNDGDKVGEVWLQSNDPDPDLGSWSPRHGAALQQSAAVCSTAVAMSGRGRGMNSQSGN